MTRSDLFRSILEKRSYLCVGLDPDLSRFPAHILETSDPVFEFNKQIIDATKDFCVAYKPNLAFYESLGISGWKSLEKTLNYIPESHFTIADAKRGDIGNTASRYAAAFFNELSFNALTVAPYMGRDSVQPFLDYPGKWAILLALTSNKGSEDFQMLSHNGKPLFHWVMEKAMEWGTVENLMFVAGATHPEKFVELREIAPDHFFLVPGVGAQGGDLDGISKWGMNDHCGLLVNSSRGILYAGEGRNFARKAGEAAKALQAEMETYLARKGLI